MKKYRKSKRLFESQAPVTFVDHNDMCMELTKYCYDIFEEDNRHIQELGKCVDDISWDDCVAGVTLQNIDEKQPTIVMNPFFAEKLLDKAEEMQDGDWNFDEDEDKYPEEYYRLFRYAILWASYLALVVGSSKISNSNPDAYVRDWKNSINTTYSELIETFPELVEEQDVFKDILEEFAMSRC